MRSPFFCAYFCTMDLTYIQTSVVDNIGYIVLDRPEKRNALNQDFVTELKWAFTSLETNDSCKVIILKSSDVAFCAGADLGYLQQLQKNSFQENVDDSTHLMELYAQIYSMEKVVISMVAGPAIAGGCGLATITDYCFAADSAKFGYSETKIGFVPAIVMVFLIRKIGEAKAREILLSGDIFSAETAKQLNLINFVIPDEQLEESTIDFAQKLISKTSMQSRALVKKMMAEIPEKTLKDALDYAAKKNAEMRESADCKRGIAAFLNKEKIKWD